MVACAMNDIIMITPEKNIVKKLGFSVDVVYDRKVGTVRNNGGRYGK